MSAKLHDASVQRFLTAHTLWVVSDLIKSTAFSEDASLRGTSANLFEPNTMFPDQMKLKRDPTQTHTACLSVPLHVLVLMFFQISL